MAFASLDSIIAALGAGNGEVSQYSKTSITTTLGRFYSLFKSAGLPAAGSTPTTGAGDVPTNATTGAIKFTSPSGSNKKHLLRMSCMGPTAGMVFLCDRLVETSGLSGTVTTAQTVNSVALTRYTDAVGVMCAIEVYSQLGATSRTATISYTNQDGTAGRSGTITIPANALAQEFIGPMTLQGTDTGVQSVQTVTLSASTGTAGDFGITLYKDLASIPYNANTLEERDEVLQLMNLPELKSGACLALYAYATTTSLGLQQGELGMAQG